MPKVVLDPQLFRVAYRCFPNGCPSGRSCCVGLTVEVSRSEMRVIDSLMDELAQVAPTLRRGREFANVFVADDDGLQIEPRDESGACPFLFARDGRGLCAIHDTALRTGRDVAAVKPRACRHWPLVLQRHARGLRISIHPSAKRMGCVAPIAELPQQPTIGEAFAPEIDELRRLVARAGVPSTPRDADRPTPLSLRRTGAVIGGQRKAK